MDIDYIVYKINMTNIDFDDFISLLKDDNINNIFHENYVKVGHIKICVNIIPLFIKFFTNNVVS